MIGASPSEHLQSSVCPFVEVTMTQSDLCVRTTTTTGPNPYWNEELTLPFKSVYNYLHYVVSITLCAKIQFPRLFSAKFIFCGCVLLTLIFWLYLLFFLSFIFCPFNFIMLKMTNNFFVLSAALHLETFLQVIWPEWPTLSSLTCLTRSPSTYSRLELPIRPITHTETHICGVRK